MYVYIIDYYIIQSIRNRYFIILTFLLQEF